MTRTNAFVWGLTLLALFTTQSFAEAKRGVKFKQDASAITAPATLDYSLDLLTLLSDPGSGHYTWSTSGDKPTWLNLDNAGNRLFGTPPLSEAGVPHSFRLGVQDGESGSLAMITMTVAIVPIWKADPISLGTQKEDQAWSLDLNQFVTVPGGGSVAFSAVSGTMPAWMSVASNGIVSGTPPWNADHTNVGAYSGIRFTATTPSGGATQVGAGGTVTKTIKGPKWKAPSFELAEAQEDFAYSKDVSGTNYVTNFENKALTFSITVGPAWLGITQAGNLFGTPGKFDVGNDIQVTVKVKSEIDGQTFEDSTVMSLNVIHTPHTPTWSGNPITLPDATTKLFYTQDLNKFVTNPDGDLLTYSIVNGPAWAKITPTGILSGTPTKPDIGMNQWTVQVAMGPFAPRTTIIIKVNKRPPTWTQSPVVLANGKGNVAYSQSVASFAVDPDGEALTFSLVSGPAWATVSATGVISGTPQASDEGLNTVRVAVSDGVNAPVPNDVKIQIAPADKPPTIHQEAISFTVKERQTFNVALNQAQYVADPQNYPLTFALVDNSDWVTLGADGALTLKPKFKDIGTYSLKFTVNNTKLTSTGFINIVVQRDPRAPVWSQNPINFAAKVMVPFTASVASLAQDLDGLPITFSKKSGPAWLSVDANGTISGTPQNADAGDNTFVVTASNDMLGADTTVIIAVSQQPPVIHQTELTFTVKERATLNVALNQPQYVQDPQGLPLQFALVDAKDFVTLAADGSLVVKPVFKDIGSYALKFTVSNTKLTSQGVLNIVVERDPRPPVWLENPIRFEAASNKPFTAAIASKAQDLDNLALTFSKVSGPSWLIVDTKGNLSGTPKTTDAGDNSFVVRVQNDKLSAETVVIVTVKNSPPVVHQDQLAFTVKERATFSVSLNQAKYIEDPQGLPLTFALLDAADWATLAADGNLTLKPLFKNIGTYALRFSTSNGSQTVNGVLNITVVRDPRAPVWSQNPINFDAKAKIPFAASVASFAQDLDGLPITFSKKSGPAWLTVDASGNLTGTPRNTDVGTNNFVVTVRNDQLGADVSVIIKVEANDAPPTIHPAALVFTVKERATLTEEINQPKYVEDPDGLPLTFTLLDATDWATLSSTGTMILKPKFKDIGSYQLKFSVTNGKLASQGVLNITVERDARPPVWSQNPIRFTGVAQTPFAASISDKVKDLDNVALTFSKKDGPAWLSIDSAGMLSGTPGDSDVGENTFVITAKNDLLGADVNVIITITPAHQGPYWTLDPIQLAEATATKTYAQSVATFAKSPVGDPLTFSKVSGPSWAFVTNAGLVIGTPITSDIGNNTFKVRVTDAHNVSADVTVIVPVVPGKPPRWLQDPIPLGRIQVGQVFQFSLAPFAKDDEGNALHFRKVSGPGWFTVSDNGLLVGTPQKTDMGEFTAVFEVSNGMASAQAGGFGKVIDELIPPEIKPNSMVFSVKERETLSVNLNSPQYVVDPQGLTLTFQMLETADWVTIGANGQLTANPKHKDVGNHTYTVKITNTKNISVQGPVVIQVIPNPQPVVWLENPIKMEGKEGKAFTNTLAGKAQSPDNMPLTFSKKDGPAWLTVAANGVLSGTPLKANVGENAFTVSVTDGTNVADATLIISVKAIKPVVWSENPIRFDAKETKLFTATLVGKVTSPEGQPITITKKDGPGWLTVSAAGVLSGTPLKANVGENIFNVTASDGLSTADVTVIVTVKPLAAVVWTENPIRFEGKETKPFAATLVGKANSPEGLPLTFAKKDGPAWLSVAGNGALTGTPLKANVGENTFTVTVTDGNSSADATVIVTVKPLAAVVWLENPIRFEGKETKPFAATLVGKANSPEGLALTFAKKDGPTWLSVASNGALSGTPQKANVGENVFTVTVTDGNSSADATVIVTVKPLAAVVWLENPIRMEAKANKPFTNTLVGKAQSPEGLALTFAKKDGPAWLNVAGNGPLSGTPLNANLGENTFTVTVTDGNSVAQATLIITVKPGNPVVWLQNPIRMTASANKPFTNTLADKAQSPDGLPLTFSKLSGAGWLNLANNGSLTGTPLTANLGENVFTVSVTDGATSAQATLIITVKGDTPQVDQIKVDQKVPGALSENLWVVDNSWYNHFGYNDQMAALKRDLRWYYDALDTAEVHHTGIFISTDYKDFKGMPIKAGDSTPLMSWSDGNLLQGFFRKMDATFNRYGCNSPLWSMFKLYQQSPSLPIYHKGFYNEDVPMDALILTIHNDAYRSYSYYTPQRNWTPDDYATNFIQFAAKEKQPYRISAVAPHCLSMGAPPELVEEGNEGGTGGTFADEMRTAKRTNREDQIEPQDPGNDLNSQYGGNPYKTLTTRTKGTYYVWDQCNTNMKKVLQDHAQKVIFRAYVNAKNRIKLSQKPANPNEIKLSIGGKEIAGNTGSANDKWYYDAATNEVVIRWRLFDMSTIKPGDMIQITYKY